MIMDDIIEKLSLLDYENSFCRGWRHKRISRIYFAHPPEQSGEDVVQRINYLYDMVYWLMGLNKEKVSIATVTVDFVNTLLCVFLKKLEESKLSILDHLKR